MGTERCDRFELVANGDVELVGWRGELCCMNGALTHKSGDWLWVTNLALDYGLSKTKSQGMRKSTDNITLSTQLGYSTNNVWYYTLMGDLNTQFAKGYNYPDKTHYISNSLRRRIRISP